MYYSIIWLLRVKLNLLPSLWLLYRIAFNYKEPFTLQWKSSKDWIWNRVSVLLDRFISYFGAGFPFFWRRASIYSLCRFICTFGASSYNSGAGLPYFWSRIVCIYGASFRNFRAGFFCSLSALSLCYMQYLNSLYIFENNMQLYLCPLSMYYSIIWLLRVKLNLLPPPPPLIVVPNCIQLQRTFHAAVEEL